MFKKLVRLFKRPADPSGYIYYAKLATPQGVFYKIGFTKKKTLAERLAYGGFGDEKLLKKELLFTFHPRAWDIEQDLLDHFGRQRAFGKYSKDPDQPLPNRGQSELFFVDVLGLDTDLYRISDKESKELANQVEEVATGLLLAVILTPFSAVIAILFALATAASLFEGNKRPIVVPPRPKHPEKIRRILETLVPSPSTVTLHPTACSGR